jgi:hypothetical protein
MTTLCEYEIEILRECAGEMTPRPWGAAVGQALEVLRSRGLLDNCNNITADGRRALRKLDHRPKGAP